MKEVEYTTNSWHYNIVISKNMLIPNIFNTREYLNKDKGCYEPKAPTDFCLYWRIVLGYIFCQIPIMLFIGYFLGYLIILSPLLSLVIFYQVLFNNLPLLNVDFLTFGSSIIIILLACLVGWKIFKYLDTIPNSNNNHILETFTTIRDVYTSLRYKYCKKIKFNKDQQK